MSQISPSLELVGSAIDAEREGQLRHVESLDTKAGIVDCDSRWSCSS